MKVFVTGGAGYIGSNCVKELLDAGHTVWVYDNLSEGHADAVDSRAQFTQADLADETALLEAMRASEAEAVIHFAAHTLVGESMVNPGKYFTNNVAAGIHLLNAATTTKVKKFIFSSTCSVYGFPEKLPISEEEPLKPINPYGESKRIMEQLLKWYHEVHGMDYAILRYFNAAGATESYGEDHKIETHLIPNILKVALGQADHCDVFGTDYPTPDGTCIRDYIHVVDLAQAHILAMEKEISSVFNLGNGSGYSVREVIEACEKVSGQRIKSIEKPRRPGDVPRLIASSDKARSQLGWKPKYAGLDEIVGSAWRWHQAHPNGYEK